MHSLRNYLSLTANGQCQSVRSFCSPAMRTSALSLRYLMESLRLIHLSDLHFTDSPYTFDWRNQGPTIDNQDSAQKSARILEFLLSNAHRFGTRIIVITGDLTDSGDEGDFKIARSFIASLKAAGFSVLSVPGNHDCCIEGNLILADVLSKIADLIPDGEIIDDVPDVALEVILWPFGIESSAIPAIRDAFKRHADIASNRERRKRFENWITGRVQYPRVVTFRGGELVLLDSVLGELYENDGDFFAQGKFGQDQWRMLENRLVAYQPERRAGRQLVVCLHHNPFHSKNNYQINGLNQADEFLAMLKRHGVDGLLFGHATPEGWAQQGGQDGDVGFEQEQEDYQISLINCENLEATQEAYPVSVLDFGARLRVVFHAGSVIESQVSWGQLPVFPV